MIDDVFYDHTLTPGERDVRGRKSPSRPSGLPGLGPWRDRAACLGTDAEIWFPTIKPGRKGSRDPYAEARAICAGCPVIEQCLEDDLRWPLVPHGFRAGFTDRERHDLFYEPPSVRAARVRAVTWRKDLR